MLVSWLYNPSVDIGLPATAALAAVALIGYLFGQRTRQSAQVTQDVQRQQELQRASGIAHQLESIADTLRQDLANHHGRLAGFRRRLGEAQSADDEQAWRELCKEAESMLAPTMELAEQLSLAYDSIRQQSDALENFSQARIDPVTGVGNARALEEKLEVLLQSASRSGVEFSVALVCVDRDPKADARRDGKERNDRLAALAKLIQSCVRDRDMVNRYGDDEFVVMMPNTRLAGACNFGQRLRDLVAERLSTTLSCGIAEYRAGDDEQSLLGRADSAYYSAKAAGGNRQFVHTGSQIREHRPDQCRGEAALASGPPSTLPSSVVSTTADAAPPAYSATS